jgi:non-ribosomal peptide synthase protein (TIGR01720 family)
MDITRIVETLAATPGRTLAHYEGDALRRRPYPDVASDVRAAAAALRACGVEAGMRVGIAAPNSYRWLVHDLALIELRAVSVALPEELWREDAERLAERWDLALLLDGTGRERRDAWVVDLDEASPDGARVRAAVRTVDPHFERPTLVFSSGTTGEPKPLVVDRRGAARDVERMVRAFGITPDDAILAFLPLSSFQQRQMVYCALDRGLELQLADPAHLARALAELRPTLFVAPPLFYETIHRRFESQPRWRRALVRGLELAAGGIPHRRARERLLDACWKPVHDALGGRMRVMITGMAPIRRATLDFFARARLPLYQVYGLSEYGIVACNRPGANRPGSVGRPLEPADVRLADDGEVILVTDGAQTVGPSPLASGDIGRLDANGYLHLIGRKKEILVTAGGHKVHPEALEARLGACSLVRRAVVFGGDGFPTLAALVCLPDGAGAREEATVDRFVTALNAELPQPSRIGRVAFTTTEFTPQNGLLTRTLKVDRRAILGRFAAVLGAAPAATDMPSRAPRTPREKTLARIWSEALGVAEVGIDDDFFELGGDSILVLQVVHRAHQAGWRLTPAEFVRSPRIAALAAAEERGGPLPAEQGSVSGSAPLTGTQCDLLAREPDGRGGATSLLLACDEPLLPALLARAAEQVVRHHDALRLRLTPDGTLWRQSHVPPEAAPVEIGRTDLARVAEPERAAALDDTVRRAQLALDPAAGPVVRLDVVRLEAGRPPHLLATVHPLVVDGVSWPILIEDLGRAYGQLAAGRAIQLPAKTASYRDWALRRSAAADGPALAADLEYWLGLPWHAADPLPRDTPLDADGARRAAVVTAALDRETSARLVRLAAVARRPLNEVLLAALVSTLGDWTAARRLAVTLAAHGRDLDVDLDLSRTVGCFVSLFPVLIEIGRASTPVATLDAVRAALAQVPGGGRGFDAHRFLNRDPRAAEIRRLRPPEIGFNYRGQLATRDGALALATLTGRQAIWERVPRRHLFDVTASLVDGRLWLDWEHWQPLHARPTVEMLAAGMLAATRTLANALAQTVPSRRSASCMSGRKSDTTERTYSQTSS